MPTVGLEYRYPFISVQSWGTQTIEPIAQVIVRPNETSIGKLPNEDSQSLIFDDTNLFKIDKFAGWDRVEGGGRANVGLQYTTQFNRGGSISTVFGQSYQLFGINSFAVGDNTNTGLGSGLDTTRSDYVARLSYQPDRIYSFTTRFRFDQDDFEVRQFETEARASFDRWSVSVLYGKYDAQPQLGFLTRREGILGSASVKLTQNWLATAAVRYDIDAHSLAGTVFGIGYIDDCLIVALNYITNYTYSGNVGTDQRVMLQMTLRTLGGTAVQPGCRRPVRAGYNEAAGSARRSADRPPPRATKGSSVRHDETDLCRCCFVAPPDDRRRIAIAAALAMTARADAQTVVVIVNGDPITQFDVEQRSKLIQLSTHKAPAAQRGDRGADQRETENPVAEALHHRRHRQGCRQCLRQHGAAHAGDAEGIHRQSRKSRA